MLGRNSGTAGGAGAFQDGLDAVQRLARSVLEREGELPPRSLTGLSADLRLGVEGRPFEDVTEALRRVLAETPSSASPRFNNQLFGGRDSAAVAAEMLTPLTNTSMYTFKVAGPQVLIESEVIARMAQRAGFLEGEGILCPGGSLSNLAAMVMARNRSIAGGRESGLTGERLTVYTSEAGHYSIRKNAGMLGIGRGNVRDVPTDAAGRMRVDAVRAMVVEDLASGALPVMINATAGTTVLGSHDDIRSIADVAGEHGIWLHVDGALGASVLLCERHRHLMDGVERADSLTWNAHKMMGVPLPCSALLVRRRGALAENFSEEAGYLFQTHDDELDPGVRSIQCGRRNDALKLWAAWLHLGDAGFDRRIARFFELARYAAGIVTADPELELVTAPESVNVCFTVRDGSSSAICERLDREARLKIGHGEAAGRQAIRLVCIDPDLDERRIDDILAEIKTAAVELGKSRSVGAVDDG